MRDNQSRSEKLEGAFTSKDLCATLGTDLYSTRFSANVPVVCSLGANRKPGGDLFDADLSSRAPFAPISGGGVFSPETWSLTPLTPSIVRDSLGLL